MFIACLLQRLELRSTFYGLLKMIVYKIPYRRARARPLGRMRYASKGILLGCALFSKFLGLNAVLVELDELSSGVPSFLKSDHGKLLRIAILCLVTWVSRGTCVMVSCSRPETVRAAILYVTSSESCVLEYSSLTVSRCFY